MWQWFLFWCWSKIQWGNEVQGSEETFDWYFSLGFSLFLSLHPVSICSPREYSMSYGNRCLLGHAVLQFTKIEQNWGKIQFFSNPELRALITALKERRSLDKDAIVWAVEIIFIFLNRWTRWYLGHVDLKQRCSQWVLLCLIGLSVFLLWN